MPLQATSGAASYDAFGGGVAAVPNYIEDVFSTWLFTQSSTGAINNGIDLAGKGGLVWQKARTLSDTHKLMDTVRGTSSALASDTTQASFGGTPYITSFNSDGFTTGSYFVNYPVASWTFRDQPKFFDVVTYTGTGSATTIAHNLGSVPGCIIVKRTDAARDWAVYHRSLGATQGIYLNSTAAAFTSLTALWNGTTPTSTVFSVGGNADVNASGGTYVAYLFAHNAGGFGLSGTDNVISCGSWSGNTTVNLGYEPQWILFRNSGAADNWTIVDNMRGWPEGAFSQQAQLYANTSGAESGGSGVFPTATGFSTNIGAGNFIYIAIRRGPMRTPTTGTSVFAPVAQNNTYGTKNTTNFPVDLQIGTTRNLGSQARRFVDRLRGISTNSTGAGQVLESQSTAAETTDSFETLGWDNTGYQTNYNYDSLSSIFYNFRRAPGFFDEVCYTGDHANNPQIPHNLTVTPELLIVKRRDGVGAWYINSPLIGTDFQLAFNNSAKSPSNTYTLTSTYFQNSTINFPTGGTFVAYLFASCPGVSKVFNYTGNGSSQTINCGFTGGARFVMIKRTDSTGDWYVWDTARGIVANNDPHLSLNTTAAEVTTNDTIDTDNTGFVVNQVSATNVNVNGASYIGLAIA